MLSLDNACYRLPERLRDAKQIDYLYLYRGCIDDERHFGVTKIGFLAISTSFCSNLKNNRTIDFSNVLRRIGQMK